MIITEDQIIERIQDCLLECDKYTLARITGEIFGGGCSPKEDDDIYEFIPDENYCGAFDKMIDFTYKEAI